MPHSDHANTSQVNAMQRLVLYSHVIGLCRIDQFVSIRVCLCIPIAFQPG